MASTPSWHPDKRVVSTKEIIGRRAFLADLFEGGNMGNIFKIDIFLDDAPEEDLSFDRLGLKVPAADVVSFLTPICRNHGATLNPARDFRGWAAISVARLKKLKVVPMVEVENKFHAHLVRDDYRDADKAETLAFRLAYEASRIGLVLPIDEQA